LLLESDLGALLPDLGALLPDLGALLSDLGALLVDDDDELDSLLLVEVLDRFEGPE
jgi:hypothetical protein